MSHITEKTVFPFRLQLGKIGLLFILTPGHTGCHRDSLLAYRVAELVLRLKSPNKDRFEMDSTPRSAKAVLNEISMGNQSNLAKPNQMSVKMYLTIGQE